MKRKKGFFYNIMIACMASVAMAGCADEESFSSSRSHLLAFSADTVAWILRSPMCLHLLEAFGCIIIRESRCVVLLSDWKMVTRQDFG